MKDARGHGSDGGSGGGMFARFWAGSISQSVHDKDQAAQALHSGTSKSDAVPVHGGMGSSYPRNPGARYYSVL